MCILLVSNVGLRPFTRKNNHLEPWIRLKTLVFEQFWVQLFAMPCGDSKTKSREAYKHGKTKESRMNRGLAQARRSWATRQLYMQTIENAGHILPGGGGHRVQHDSLLPGGCRSPGYVHVENHRKRDARRRCHRAIEMMIGPGGDESPRHASAPRGRRPRGPDSNHAVTTRSVTTRWAR